MSIVSIAYQRGAPVHRVTCDDRTACGESVGFDHIRGSAPHSVVSCPECREQSADGEAGGQK